MPDSSKSVSELVVKVIRSRDRQAFDKLMLRFFPAIRRFCYSALGNRDDADELVREIFLHAWMSLPRLKNPDYFKTWLYRIARHKVIDYYRARKISTVLLEEILEDDIQIACYNEEPVRELIESPVKVECEYFDNEKLQIALDELPEHYRVVVILRDIAELSYADIAAVLHCSENAVRMVLHRARALLRKKLDSTLANPPVTKSEQNQAEQNSAPCNPSCPLRTGKITLDARGSCVCVT